MEANSHKEIENLLQNIPTLSLSINDENQEPNASLLPFISHPELGLMVFASTLSPHTAHLKRSPSCSVLIYDPNGPDPFALKRIQLKCSVSLIESTHNNYNDVLDQMQAKLGSTMNMLRSLPGFFLFALKPVSGRLILGFGKAFVLQGYPLQIVEHIKK
ncbi:MAG: pyridoxamine 5'-phosphate oxidase family protein [Candidatus Cloacimonetes bacterium]|nr:pyridoxamine 5'-phosphate oxidase family protein [Candidatus Cloacimonadota bacterium]